MADETVPIMAQDSRAGYVKLSTTNELTSSQDATVSFTSSSTLNNRRGKADGEPDDEWHNIERKERLDRVLGLTNIRQSTFQEANLPDEEAMKNLFAYLHIDKDGGIMNLESGDAGELEFTKLHILLKRDFMQIVLSFVLVIRIGVNVPHIFHTSTHALYCYFSKECSAFVHKDLVDACILPLEIMAVAIAAFEFIRGSWFIGQALLDMCRFACASAEEDNNSAQCRAKRRYFFLSNLCFEHLVNLQNFSALLCLGYVHPGLIGHAWKELNMCNVAARAVFERLFGLKEDEVGDDDLHDMVIQIIMKKEMENDPTVMNLSNRDKLDEKILQYSLLSSYRLFKILNKLDGPLPKVYSIKDDTAMSNHALKVSLIGFLECLGFVVMCIMYFLFGSAAFVVKLSRVALVLLHDQSTLIMVLLDLFAFLNQIIGIIQVQKLLRERIFRFLFGGQDANISDEERALMAEYQAILAEKMWVAPNYNRIQKALSLLALSDDDIQRLVLEESHHDKRMLTKAVKAVQTAQDKAQQSVCRSCTPQSAWKSCVYDNIRGVPKEGQE